MPPRHHYWTIILEGKPTAFRAHTQEELLPTLRQLQARHPDAVMNMTVLQWIQKYNVYTAQTGQPLIIRAVRALATAGAGGTARAIAYRRDPQIVKMHIPMPHRFLPVWQTGPITFDVPGIFRLSGVEIRRPGAFRYLDLI